MFNLLLSVRLRIILRNLKISLQVVIEFENISHRPEIHENNGATKHMFQMMDV